jgi:hypothetical protein
MVGQCDRVSSWFKMAYPSPPHSATTNDKKEPTVLVVCVGRTDVDPGSICATRPSGYVHGGVHWSQ